MRLLAPVITVLAILLLAILRVGTQADDQAKEQDPSIDKLASELERVLPKDAEASRSLVQLHPDFRIELVAGEPLIHDPAAIDFDENGRIFVAQLPEYNAYAVKDFKGQGSVHMLTDSDGDGRYDTRTVFADKLNYPTAIACWDGGVFIGAAPDLLYAKDTDGDGVADIRTVVMTGFGKDHAGEAHLNSMRWGFDNRFHLSTSLSGGEITVTGEKDRVPRSVRNRGIILDPRNPARFELTSGAGQHGMSMDNWGHKFVCSNSVPAQLLMYDDRYVARNPHLKAPAVAVDIAPQGKFTRLYRTSPPEPWRALRTNLRRTGRFKGSDEGGTPFGFFTGATGVTIYRGNAWPEQFHGNLLVGDIANNLIYRATLSQDGLQLVATRADKDVEFLSSRDIWFRPVQMANAPDGTLYVLDFCRELIEGAAFLPPEFLKYIDVTSGNDRGRIYRIAPKDFKYPGPPQLGKASGAELVALLEHPNGWHRDTASRLLYQRQDSSVSEALRTLARSSSLAEGRMGALYSLQGIGTLDEADLLTALGDPAPIVRAHALRLAESMVSVSPSLVVRMGLMTSDSDLRVRYQLAFSLGAARGRSRNAALATLALQDGKDRWMRLAIASSLFEGAGEVFSQLGSDPGFRQVDHGRAFLVTLAGQIGAANRADEIVVVIRTLQLLEENEKTLGQQLVEALASSQKGESRQRILASAGGKAGEILAQLLSEARTVAVDPDQDVEKRAEAIRSLQLAPLAEIQPLLERMLTLQQPGLVQSATLQTLAAYPDNEVARLIVDHWREMSPALRATAAETLLSRPAWITILLDAVEDKSIGRGDIDPLRIQLLTQNPDKQIADRVAALFRSDSLGRREDVIREYRVVLEIEGDAGRGKEFFKKICSACHQLEGVGTAVGADLKAIRNRGMDAVLLNVLDPNREVKPRFLTYFLVTDDGRSLTGMIQTENANSLTLRRPDGTTLDIQRAEIDMLRSSGLSFMPEGLEKQLDKQAMADLLAYLDSIR
jgi:putative membrane-bound dehydrogenase-like protein